MSRTKVTKELVFEVASRQMKEGRQPSAWSIHEELKCGSLETIQKYLVKWRENIKASEEENFNMPDDVAQTEHKYLNEIWKDMGRTSADLNKMVADKENTKVAASEHEFMECLKRLAKVTENLENVYEKRVADKIEINELKRELNVKEGELQEARKNAERTIGDIQQKFNEEQVKYEQLLIELALARGRLEV